MFPHSTWRGALQCKALVISMKGIKSMALSHRIIYALWGNDIWFGSVPIIKTMIGANIVVWILLFLTR